MDGETWTLLSQIKNHPYNDEVRKFEIEDSVEVQYVKIVADRTNGNWFTARMFNIYQDLIKNPHPTAGIAYSTTSPTTEDVEVRLVNASADIEITNNNGSDTYVIHNNNESFTFEFRDPETGGTGTATAKVTWIDREAPTAKVKYSTITPTDGEVVAFLHASEDVKITNNADDKYTFTTNGSFEFEFEDAAGNKGTATAKVNWILGSTAAPDMNGRLPGDPEFEGPGIEDLEQAPEQEGEDQETETKPGESQGEENPETGTKPGEDTEQGGNTGSDGNQEAGGNTGTGGSTGTEGDNKQEETTKPGTSQEEGNPETGTKPGEDTEQGGNTGSDENQEAGGNTGTEQGGNTSSGGNTGSEGDNKQEETTKPGTGQEEENPETGTKPGEGTEQGGNTGSDENQEAGGNTGTEQGGNTGAEKNTGLNNKKDVDNTTRKGTLPQTGSSIDVILIIAFIITSLSSIVFYVKGKKMRR